MVLNVEASVLRHSIAFVFVVMLLRVVLSVMLMSTILIPTMVSYHLPLHGA